MLWPFYVLACIALVASLYVVLSKHPVSALLAMIMSLLAVAGIFFMAGAPFAGVLEVIVYAGAILVLFVFVVMMLNLGEAVAAEEVKRLDSTALAVPVGLGAVLVVTLGYLVSGSEVVSVSIVGPKAVGTSLFTQYVLVVEAAAMLLLAALIAAYHLAKKTDQFQMKEKQEEESA